MNAAEKAIAQLRKAADQFAFYADEHAKKGTKEGATKGATNHQWALACARAAGDAEREAATARTAGAEAAQQELVDQAQELGFGYDAPTPPSATAGRGDGPSWVDPEEWKKAASNAYPVLGSRAHDGFLLGAKWASDAALASPAPEPAFWLVTWPDGTFRGPWMTKGEAEAIADSFLVDGWTATPLYLAPPASAPAADAEGGA